VLLSLVLAATVLSSASSCGLLGLVDRPEFGVSGARVALMPFIGPETWWYGENPTAEFINQRTASLLREAGAQVIISAQIVRELQNYTGDTDPPWIDYGKRLQADYVIVGNLLTWKVDKATSVGFVPGTASMSIQIHDVSDKRVVFEKHFEVSVGIQDESTDIFTDRESTKRALVNKIMREWKAIFIGSSGFS
jgi:hypothetical protein